jgi:glycerol-3-phosphate dehydrogenase
MPSVTSVTPITGAGLYAAAEKESAAWAGHFGWSDTIVEHLLRRYGDRLREIVEICTHDPANAAPLASAPRYLRAEVVHAVSHEGALHLDDVLSRRTHIAAELPERGVSAAEEVAAIVAPILGWDERRREVEVFEYSALATAEANARELHDDRDAARFFMASMSHSGEPAGDAPASMEWIRTAGQQLSPNR